MKSGFTRLEKLMDTVFIDRFRLLAFLASIILMLFIFGLQLIGILEPLEARFHDFRFGARNRLSQSMPGLFGNPKIRSRSDEVILVQITDECLHAYGKWPWTRAYFADLIEQLSATGARVIGFDISFFDVDLNHPRDDAQMAEALKRAGNVVMASELSRRSRIMQDENGAFTLPSMADEGIGREVLIVNQAIEAFLRHARGHGFVNIDLAGTDGVLRKAPLTKSSESKIHASLGLKLFMEWVGSTNVKILGEDRIQIGDYQVPFYARADRYNIAQNLLTTSIDKPLFERLVYLNFLDSSSASPFHSVSVRDVLSKKVDSHIFKDKVVLIGFNAEGGILDKKLTPFGIMPGVEIQATVIDNLIHKTFLIRNSNTQIFLTLLVTTLIGLILNLRLGFQAAFMAEFGLIAAFGFLSLLLFCKSFFLLDFTPVLIQGILSFLMMRLLLVTLSLRKKMVHLSTLNSLANQFFTILEQDTLCNTIFDHFHKWTGASHGIIMICDPATEQTEYSTFGKLGDDFMVEVSRPEFRQALFECWKKEPRVMTLGNVQKEQGTFLNHHQETDILFLPLILKDKPYGTIMLLKEDFEEFLQEADHSFHSTLGQIIVAALENARLYRLATVDGLTGLFVRSFLDVQIQKEFLRAARYGGTVSFMMSDIDHFKNFNDTYGHAMGDKVLRIVSDEFRKTVRETDIAARYGGEELCVILPNTGKEGAMIIAERIRANIEGLKIDHETGPVRITTSIGVTSYPENKPADVAAFMKEADYALYMAKENGRNQVRFFSKRKGGEE